MATEEMEVLVELTKTVERDGKTISRPRRPIKVQVEISLHGPWEPATFSDPGSGPDVQWDVTQAWVEYSPDADVPWSSRFLSDEIIAKFVRSPEGEAQIERAVDRRVEEIADAVASNTRSRRWPR